MWFSHHSIRSLLFSCCYKKNISRSAQPWEYLREVRNTLLKCQTQTLMSPKTNLCTYMKEKTERRTCFCASNTFSLSIPHLHHSWLLPTAGTKQIWTLFFFFFLQSPTFWDCSGPGWCNISACPPQAGLVSPLGAAACNSYRLLLPLQWNRFKGSFNHEASWTKCFLL